MRVLIYSDSLVFGGHEEMLLKHVEKSVWPKCTWIGLICAKSNKKYINAAQKLKSVGKVSEVITVNDSNRRLDQFLLFINIKSFLTNIVVLFNLKPDIVMVSAGRIESCNLGFWCAKVLRLPIIFYLPMVHKQYDINPGLLSRFRDFYNHIIYLGAYGFIVITDGQKRDLISRGINQISVVKNIIDIPNANCRKSVNKRNLTLGFLGRIHQKQKNVNFMVSLVCSLSALKPDIRCIVQGDGPDRDHMIHHIDSSGFGSCFEIRDWWDNVDIFFNDIDILVVPSFYEGMPLVMLQALVREIPVVATRVDGMAEVLPDSALFSVGDVAQAKFIVSNLNKNSDEWEQVFQRVKKAIITDTNSSLMSNSILGFIKS